MGDRGGGVRTRRCMVSMLTMLTVRTRVKCLRCDTGTAAHRTVALLQKGFIPDCVRLASGLQPLLRCAAQSSACRCPCRRDTGPRRQICRLP